jgi:hypothetical protein
MKSAYESWFRDVSATRGFEPPAIHIGTKHENSSRLSRQDLRGFGPNDAGYWKVHVEPGVYRVRLLLARQTRNGQQDKPTRVYFVCGDLKRSGDVQPGENEVLFDAVTLTADDTQIQAWAEQNGKLTDIGYVELAR